MAVVLNQTIPELPTPNNVLHRPSGREASNREDFLWGLRRKTAAGEDDTRPGLGNKDDVVQLLVVIFTFSGRRKLEYKAAELRWQLAMAKVVSTRQVHGERWSGS